ncbi:hypothetical protein Ddc_18750 [Ditylenchus destructor]|nr:hypothetical protein Ddc_18750 [Ditylenchus destructor]
MIKRCLETVWTRSKIPHKGLTKTKTAATNNTDASERMVWPLCSIKKCPNLYKADILFGLVIANRRKANFQHRRRGGTMEITWEDIPRFYNMSSMMTETWNLPKDKFLNVVSRKLKTTLMSKKPPYTKIEEIAKDFSDFTGFPAKETAMRFGFNTFESFIKSHKMEEHVCISMNAEGQHEFLAKVQDSHKLQHITDNVQESYENKVQKAIKHDKEKFDRAMQPENRGLLMEGRKLLCRLVHELNGSEKVSVPVQAVIEQYAKENNNVPLNEKERRKYFKRGNIQKIIEDYCSEELELIFQGAVNEKYLKLRMPYNEIRAMHDNILETQQNNPSASNGTGVLRQSRMDTVTRRGRNEFLSPIRESGRASSPRENGRVTVKAPSRIALTEHQTKLARSQSQMQIPGSHSNSTEVRGRQSPSLSRNQNEFVCMNKFCWQQFRTEQELRDHQRRCCDASTSSNFKPSDAEPLRQVSQKNRKVDSPYYNYNDENAELWNASHENLSLSSMPPEDPVPIPWNVMNHDLNDQYTQNDSHPYQKTFSTLQGSREISSSTACIPQPSRFSRRASSRDSSDSDSDEVMNILENEKRLQQKKQDTFCGTSVKRAREPELIYSPNSTPYDSELPFHSADNFFDAAQSDLLFNDASEFAQKLGLSVTDISHMGDNWDIGAFHSNSVAGASSSAGRKRRKPPMPLRIQRLSQLITSIMTYRGRDSMELRTMSELLECVDPEYGEVVQGNLDCLGNLDIFMEKYCPSVTVSIIRGNVYVSLHKIKE